MSSSAEAGRPRWIGPLAALLVFALAAYFLHGELARLHVRDVLGALHAIPASALKIAFALTAASYLALGCYDVLALAYLRVLRNAAAPRVPLTRVLSASFIANAFGHNLGFAAFTGAAFRLRLYAASRLTATDVALVTGYTSLTTSLGIALLAGLSFTADPSRAAITLHTVPGWCLVIGGVLLAFVLAFAGWSSMPRLALEIRGWRLRPPGTALGLAQIALGSLDLAFTAGVLWVLLPHSTHVGYVSFLGIFAVAIAAGLITHLPGGIGVFEAIVVLAVPESRPDALLGSLLAYRIVYYLTPLAAAALTFGGEELGAQLARLATVRRRAAAFVAPVVPAVAGALTFVAGTVLLVAGATPELDTRLAPLTRVLPLAVVEIAHLAASIIGLGLLVLARALFRRIRAAYTAVVWLLVAGAIASILKGFDYEEAAILGIVLGVLALGRAAFHRPASVLRERFTPAWAASIAGVVLATIWIGFFAYRQVEYSSDLWWRFALDANAPRMLRATLIVSILAAGYLVRSLLRPAERAALESALTLGEIERAVDHSPRALACAALTGDKRFVTSDSRESFIMYQVQGRSWIALGDPVGAGAESEELVWRFRELADEHGGRPVFYQTSVERAPLYLDLGLAELKIGEEARVPLGRFSLDGGRCAELRLARQRAERDRASFELVPREEVAALLPVLETISEEWLAANAAAEKRFTAGAFSEAYIRRFPVGLVRRDGAPVAFANLWITSRRIECAVDLMRFGPDAPAAAMDYLLLELMLWAQATGYEWFSLGVAPLAGLDRDPLAPAWHRAGHALFAHGEHFHNFEALRRYKAKFHPVWEPKYLMAPGVAALPHILVDVAMLITSDITRPAISPRDSAGAI
ncbi:MAG TPA: bifunctional lysylphosphatidylglycerol flippase/synthetase MprF [Steroidobacteraceae bacterium]|nr:bifunctional lysylphosphatidylglycerol flippase/synthetase MprF [Steroidobacteraceae bacterium]